MSAYVEEVRADRPVAYWPFDEPDGVWPRDRAGGGLDMTSTSGSVWRRQGIEGRGHAGHSNGRYSRSVVMTVTDNLTLEMWLMPMYILGVNQEFLMNGAYTSNGYAIRWSSNNALAVSCHGVANTSDSARVAPTFQWTHVVIVRDSGTWRYFFDGKLDTLNAGTVTPNTPSSETTPGCPTTYGSTERGYAHIALYDKVLPHSRILRHYQAMQESLFSDVTRQPIGQAAFVGGQIPMVLSS